MVLKFLKRSTFGCFGTSKVLISDGGFHFCNSQLARAIEQYEGKAQDGITIPSHTNSQAYVSNREIKIVFEKAISSSRRDWSSKLDEPLWAYQTTFKSPISLTLFQMVYGKSLHLPVELEHKA